MATKRIIIKDPTGMGDNVDGIIFDLNSRLKEKEFDEKELADINQALLPYILTSGSSVYENLSLLYSTVKDQSIISRCIPKEHRREMDEYAKSCDIGSSIPKTKNYNALKDIIFNNLKLLLLKFPKDDLNKTGKNLNEQQEDLRRLYDFIGVVLYKIPYEVKTEREVLREQLKKECIGYIEQCDYKTLEALNYVLDAYCDGYKNKFFDVSEIDLVSKHPQAAQFLPNKDKISDFFTDKFIAGKLSRDELLALNTQLRQENPICSYLEILPKAHMTEQINSVTSDLQEINDLVDELINEAEKD